MTVQRTSAARRRKRERNPNGKGNRSGERRGFWGETGRDTSCAGGESGKERERERWARLLGWLGRLGSMEKGRKKKMGAWRTDVRTNGWMDGDPGDNGGEGQYAGGGEVKTVQPEGFGAWIGEKIEEKKERTVRRASKEVPTRRRACVCWLKLVGVC